MKSRQNNKTKISWDERGVTPLPMFYRVILKQALHGCLRREQLNGKTLQANEINLSFVSGKEIMELNLTYRNKNEVTDVLSFPPSGDIVICTEVAIIQAEKYGHSNEREFAFLAVHGLLHLLGYDHKTPEDEAMMIQKQEEILTVAGMKR